MSLAALVEQIVTDLFPSYTFLLSSDYEADRISYDADSSPMIILNNELSDEDTIKTNLNFQTKEKIQISVLLLDKWYNTDESSSIHVEIAKGISRKIYYNLFLKKEIIANDNKIIHTPTIREFNSARTGVVSLAYWDYNHVISCT